MNEPTQFWAVWRETGGAAPSKRHPTKEEALAEAGRLATQSAERYYVLEAIGVVAPVVTPVSYKAFPQLWDEQEIKPIKMPATP